MKISTLDKNYVAFILKLCYKNHLNYLCLGQD